MNFLSKSHLMRLSWLLNKCAALTIIWNRLVSTSVKNRSVELTWPHLQLTIIPYASLYAKMLIASQRLLAKNNGSILLMIRSKLTGEIILLAGVGVCIMVGTIFVTAGVVWFSLCPCLILPLQQSVVNPVEFKSQQLFESAQSMHPRCDCSLTLYQVQKKWIFISWFDYGQVTPHTLALIPNMKRHLKYCA